MFKQNKKVRYICQHILYHHLPYHQQHHQHLSYHHLPYNQQHHLHFPYLQRLLQLGYACPKGRARHLSL